MPKALAPTPVMAFMLLSCAIMAAPADPPCWGGRMTVVAM